MTTRLHIGAFVGLAVVVWLALLLIRDTPVSWEHLWPFSFVVFFLTVAVAAFERWGWAWRRLHGWFVHRPDLRGTWLVELKSDWKDPETQQRIDPITCFMAVRQTLTTLSMRLMTRESTSWLLAHKIVHSNDGVYHVAGVYANKPGLELRGVRSEIHYGSIWLEVQGDPPTSLEGHYWTDRNTQGSMLLTRRVPQVCARFEEASRLFRGAE